ncbi:MAG: type III secretion inner membrane ring lipoprotein SctJ [Chlamydiae bacterium]|nr:type III secretion inner membrane ring lipoprotein SctJ [Chlamydiota bacterium]
MSSSKILGKPYPKRYKNPSNIEVPMISPAFFRCSFFNINPIAQSSKMIARFLFLCASLFFLTGCESNMLIVTDIEEREANEIIVFLASKGISAYKTSVALSGPGASTGASLKYSISVEQAKSTEAMAILNQNGLPRIKGTNLLDLFAKQGLMTSDKEETIRYQAGLAEQIANTIRKIDGVIDADVQLSFPPENTGVIAIQQEKQKITAAVYVKHQGVLDDPNSHLVIKIKRLVSGSVNGLDVNDVTVISDRSRFTDITINAVMEEITPKAKEYVSIWSIVMSKNSAARFRFLFFFLSFLVILLAVISGWMIWKFYPTLKRKGGIKELLHPIPIEPESQSPEEPSIRDQDKK